MKKKLLWIAHSPTLQTGFGRATSNIISYLGHDWDIHVIGIGYNGDPHGHPCKIYSAGVKGDVWGLNRLEELYFAVKPDVTLIMMEPWNIMPYVMNLRGGLGSKPKVVGYAVVDGENMKGEHAHWLSQCDVAIYPCDFAVEQAKKAGYKGYAYIIPHGVNPLIYQPCDKQWARKQIGLGNLLDADAFIFNNVNMNQPRKCIDLSVEAFAIFLQMADHPKEPMLNLHLSKKENEGWDIGNLGQYYEVRGRISVVSEDIKISEPDMKYVYNAADVQLTTTSGEGFGLTTLEGMACGIPQIVPSFAALGDWAQNGAVQVPVSVKHVMAKQQNVVRYTPAPEDMAKAMLELYRNDAIRKLMGKAARQLALQDIYRWSTIAGGFDEALNRAVESEGVSGTMLVQAEAAGPSGAPLAQEQRQ